MRFSVQTWFYLLTDKHTFCTWTHESSVLSWSGSNTVRLFKLMVKSLKTHQWCNDMDVCMELIMSTKLKETWHTKFLQELKCFSTDSYYLCVLQSLSRLCVSVTITKCFCLWQAEVFILTSVEWTAPVRFCSVVCHPSTPTGCVLSPSPHSTAGQLLVRPRSSSINYIIRRDDSYTYVLSTQQNDVFPPEGSEELEVSLF